jgi:hypothetical protein
MLKHISKEAARARAYRSRKRGKPSQGKRLADRGIISDAADTASIAKVKEAVFDLFLESGQSWNRTMRWLIQRRAKIAADGVSRGRSRDQNSKTPSDGEGTKRAR